MTRPSPRHALVLGGATLLFGAAMLLGTLIGPAGLTAGGVLLDLLDRYGIKATLFVPGLIAKNHPELLPAFVARGHEIGLHGYFHELATEAGPEEFAHQGDGPAVAVALCGRGGALRTWNPPRFWWIPGRSKPRN